MDFLTQPLHFRAPAPSATSPRLSDDASVLTASTSDTSDARLASGAAFDQLRTATKGDRPTVLPGEAMIEIPSTRSGDWRAYGRVEGRVVLWENGALTEKNVKSSSNADCELWAISGTLWFTKRSEIIVVLDQTGPPQQIAHQPGRRPTGRRLSLSRTRSSSPPGRTRGPADEEGAKPEVESSGFLAKVLDAVRPGRKERRGSSSSGRGLSLSRSRSRPEATLSQAYGGGPGSTSASPGTVDRLAGDTARLTFEDPPSSATSSSPFPLYKGHAVTAIYIASPSHIQSHRFFPRTSTSNSPFFSFAKPTRPLSSPPVSPGLDSHVIEHPIVELDIVDPAHLGSCDAGKKREATIGLSFVEVLCASEAEDFSRLVEAAMQNSLTDEATIHRTVSRSLETANTQRRKSFSLKV